MLLCALNWATLPFLQTLITFFIYVNFSSFNFLSGSKNCVVVLTRSSSMNLFVAVSPIAWTSSRSVLILPVVAIPIDKLISSISEKGFKKTELIVSWTSWTSHWSLFILDSKRWWCIELVSEQINSSICFRICALNVAVCTHFWTAPWFKL